MVCPAKFSKVPPTRMPPSLCSPRASGFCFEGVSGVAIFLEETGIIAAVFQQTHQAALRIKATRVGNVKGPVRVLRRPATSNLPSG